jgi:hypothetical protein
MIGDEVSLTAWGGSEASEDEKNGHQGGRLAHGAETSVSSEVADSAPPEAPSAAVALLAIAGLE